MTTKSFFQSGSCLKQGMLAVAILLSSISFTACSDDDDKDKTEPEAKAKEVKFEAQSYTEWSYFSFEKGDFVSVDQENYATDSNWDIAFLRYYIRTNGGISGKGQGAALDTKETKFDAVTTIPTTGFITDDNISIITGSGMPPKYRTDAGSPAFTVKESQSWATFTPPMGPWVYNNNVFIVRTADGQYAKLIMKSFLNDEDKSGHVTFEYVYPFK